jgi:glutaminyl-peptide cyclotransferase
MPKRELARTSLAAGLALVAAACGACSPDPPVPPTPAATNRSQTGDDSALPGDLGARAFIHVEKLVGFGARHSGTEGWSRAVDYIAEELQELGLDVRRDRWTEEREGLTYENVSARIPGRVADRIVLGAHHDTKITEGHEDPAHNFAFVGANDSASGVGLLLALAEHWVAHPPVASVDVVFFDGEESVPFTWDLTRALFGSRRYAAQYRDASMEPGGEPPIRAMVLLDMVGSRELSIDDESMSDRGLHRIFAESAEACGHSAYFFRNRLQVSDDHMAFLELGIPAIDLIDIYDNPQWHTPDDTLEHIAPESLQVVGEVVLTALPRIESKLITIPDEDGR